MRCVGRKIESDSTLNDLRHWLVFNCTRGIGPVNVRALLQQFGSLEAAWNGLPSGWVAAGLDRRAARPLKAAQSNLDLDRLGAEHAVGRIQLPTNPTGQRLLGALGDDPVHAGTRG